MRVEAALGLAIAGLTALTGACGRTAATGETRANRPTAGEDICSLLTADDIRSVTGVAPGEPTLEGNRCTWPSGESNEFLVHLTVAPSVIQSYDELSKQYREDLKSEADTVLHQIAGAGRFAVGFNDLPGPDLFGSGFVQVYTVQHQEKHALDLAKRAYARRQ